MGEIFFSWSTVRIFLDYPSVSLTAKKDAEVKVHTLKISQHLNTISLIQLYKPLSMKLRHKYWELT